MSRYKSGWCENLENYVILRIWDVQGNTASSSWTIEDTSEIFVLHERHRMRVKKNLYVSARVDKMASVLNPNSSKTQAH